MGWLGYFAGKNRYLKRFTLEGIDAYVNEEGTNDTITKEKLELFCIGLQRNKSIQECIFRESNLYGGEIFQMLDSFFKNNRNLTEIEVEECDVVAGGCRSFSLALAGCTNRSLKRVSLINNQIEGGGQVIDIIIALSTHPELKELAFLGANIGRNETS